MRPSKSILAPLIVAAVLISIFTGLCMRMAHITVHVKAEVETYQPEMRCLSTSDLLAISPHDVLPGFCPDTNTKDI